jgi:hypothetical protein
MTLWINDKLGHLASRGAYSLKFSARTFNVLEYRMTLDLRPILRHHLCHLPRYFLWKFSIFFCHHELFGLQAILEFWCIEFEPTHPLIGMSLRKVLTSLRLALRKRVSRFIPIVATLVGYLGSEVFNLTHHSPESILLVLPLGVGKTRPIRAVFVPIFTGSGGKIPNPPESGWGWGFPYVDTQPTPLLPALMP